MIREDSAAGVPLGSYAGKPAVVTMIDSSPRGISDLYGKSAWRR